MDSIKYVFIRPKMYTLGGTVTEVYSFLKGYTGGLSAHRPSVELARYPILGEWEDFRDWLGKKLGTYGSQAFDIFVLRYGDNDEAMKTLLNYYDEFVIEWQVTKSDL